MKSILLSIKPKYVELIASGEKTIEVRKSKPSLATPFKCYIYCTKAKEVVDIGKTFSWGKEVIGEFVCDRIKNIDIPIKNRTTPDMQIFSIESCLPVEELANYIGNGQVGYGWHISDLKIYDKPKSLEMFPVGKIARDCGCGGYIVYDKVLTRPPQSWQFIETGE